MANYAVVKNGVVEGIIVWDGVTEFSVPGSELIEATNGARIGGSWDGSVFAFVEHDLVTLTYDEKRKSEYPSVDDFMEAYTEKEIGSVSTKWDAYVIAYNKVRTDNPKP